MRIKIKFLLLIPLTLPLFSCSSSDKITFKTGDDTFTTYYNDTYFNMENDVHHEEIALASHAMALATFNGNEDYAQRSYYLRDLWKKEGFEKIWFNESFYYEPGTDTIGFGIASKEIKIFGGSYTLIAIAVRGGNYGAEWASNFTIGYGGDSKGFSEASDLVIEGLTNFVNSKNIKGHVKFWISGFSRAAVTSNLVAGKLLNRMAENDYISDKITYDKRDFYAYCFEPPLGAYTTKEKATSDLYQGIHNYLNYNDLVPLVAPHEWGFVRYGTDHYYPDRLTDIYFDLTEREKLITQYHFTYGAQNFPKYTVDEWKFFDVGGDYAEKYNLPRESLHPSQGRFCRSLIHEIAVTGYGSRFWYAFVAENGFRDIFKTVMGLNEDIKGIDTSDIVDIVFEYAFIRTLISELENNNYAAFAQDVEMLFLQIFGANEENIDAVMQLYYSNYLSLSFLAGGLGKRQDVIAQLLYRDNAMNIVIGHMPQLSYSFLSSCDTRLHGTDACKFNDGTYKILHIDNPNNFSLFEMNTKRTVFTVKNGEMSSDYISAEKFNDRSIDVYLPKNGAYQYVGDSTGISLRNSDPVSGDEPLMDNMGLSGEF